MPAYHGDFSQFDGQGIAERIKAGRGKVKARDEEHKKKMKALEEAAAELEKEDAEEYEDSPDRSRAPHWEPEELKRRLRERREDKMFDAEVSRAVTQRKDYKHSAEYKRNKRAVAKVERERRAAEKAEKLPLTAQQKMLVEHYAQTGDKAQAAIKAGYHRTTANNQASKQLAKPHVQAYLEEITKAPSEHRIKTANQRKEWLQSVIDGHEKEYHVTSRGDVIARPVRMIDRIKAAELLAKMSGELLEKHAHTHEISVNRVVKRFDGS